jgi:hypothetical protein
MNTSEVLSVLAILVSTVSAGAAIWSARSAHAALAREHDRDEARRRVRAEVAVVNDDDEGPGPQRRVKLFLSPPQDGDVCELSTCELVSPAGRIEVMYGGTTAKGQPVASLTPTIVLSGERKQVNLILHLLKFHGDTVLKFSGFRHNPARSPVELEISIPGIGSAHGGPRGTDP